jgi:Tfp pilus assembly protein PilF
LRTINNLAILYANQGKYELAEPLYQRALATRERVLGPEHPDTIRVRNNYANFLQKMKQKTKAVGAKPRAPRKQGRK